MINCDDWIVYWIILLNHLFYNFPPTLIVDIIQHTIIFRDSFLCQCQFYSRKIKWIRWILYYMTIYIKMYPLYHIYKYDLETRKTKGLIQYYHLIIITLLFNIYLSRKLINYFVNKYFYLNLYHKYFFLINQLQ